MAKNRNLIILSVYLFILILSGVIYTAYSGNSNGISDPKIYSIEPAIVIK